MKNILTDYNRIYWFVAYADVTPGDFKQSVALNICK